MVNKTLKPGVSRFSRSASYARRKLYATKAVSAKATPKTIADTRKVTVSGPANGSARIVPTTKAPKYYPATDVPVKKIARKTHRPQSLRASLVPGTILILLAGRFAGKRVVLLKALPSGLLLVSGPHKINGVPLRRVNPAYVIATSTHINVQKVDVAKISDDFFKKAKTLKAKATEEALFEESKKVCSFSSDSQKRVVDPARLSAQKAVDAPLLAAVKAVPGLKAYLNASFALSKGQLPHLIKF